jgi:ATP/maltotriose-dependent transcriptional regulator MalT
VLGVVPTWAPSRRGVISRDDLVKRLLDDAGQVVVAAPAMGSAVDARAGGARPRDEDPSTFVRHLAAALDRVEPVEAALLRTLNGVGRSVDTDLVPALGRHLDRRSPFVLVVDDVRAPHASRLRARRVMAHVPPGSQLALVGRSIRARLARRRLHGQVVEVDAADLAMGPGRGRPRFRPTASTSRTRSGAPVAQTEGLARWPAPRGAGAAAAPGARAEAFGRHRLVGDFLVEEVLDLDPDTVEFLVRLRS